MPGRFNIVAARTFNKNIIVKKTLPDVSGYGVTYVYDLEAPEDIVTLRGECFEQAEVDAFLAVLATQGGVISQDDASGRTWSGFLTAVSYEGEGGTDDYSVSLRIRQGN